MKCLLLFLAVRHFEMVFDFLECFVCLTLSGSCDLWPQIYRCSFSAFSCPVAMSMSDLASWLGSLGGQWLVSSTNDHVRPCNLKPQQRDLTPVLRRPVEPAGRYGIGSGRSAFALGPPSVTSATMEAISSPPPHSISKRTMRRPTRQPFRGRLIRLGRMSESSTSSRCAGVVATARTRVRSVSKIPLLPR